MSTYQQFSITHSEHFTFSKFGQPEVTIQKVIEQSTTQPAAKIATVKSLVINPPIESNAEKDHPNLTALIAARSLQLRLTEDLFAVMKDPVSKLQFQQHIMSCYSNAASLYISEPKNEFNEDR